MDKSYPMAFGTNLIRVIMVNLLAFIIITLKLALIWVFLYTKMFKLKTLRYCQLFNTSEQAMEYYHSNLNFKFF